MKESRAAKRRDMRMRGGVARGRDKWGAEEVRNIKDERRGEEKMREGGKMVWRYEKSR